MDPAHWVKHPAPVNPNAQLSRSFYARPSLQVCRELLGKRLVRVLAGVGRLEGWINEVEAYIGQEDLGCHARSGRTARNETMWGPPGHAYVYFTYGMHWVLNLVTQEAGFPAAVLLRGLVPLAGLEEIRQRRAGMPESKLTDGPAKLCRAFHITGEWDGYDLTQSDARLYVAEGIRVPDSLVRTTPRIGLNNVPEPWKSKPWRFAVAPDSFPHDQREDKPR